MNITNLQNENRKFINDLGFFHVLEYAADLSVNSSNATSQYFMSKMNVRRRQVVCDLNGNNTIVTQAGAMQWTAGNVRMDSGVKGVGDFMKKAFKGVVTNESAAKPTYTGAGVLVLEPTYKHIILKDLSQWRGGLVIEDGMFLACDGSVQHNVISRKNVSSALLGGEGLFNMVFTGQGVVALESNVPEAELIQVDLTNDELRIDGSLAVCWSDSLEFTVEKSTKSLIGSAVSGEGLVNVYRGTGTVLMSCVASTKTLATATATGNTTSGAVGAVAGLFK